MFRNGLLAKHVLYSNFRRNRYFHSKFCWKISFTSQMFHFEFQPDQKVKFTFTNVLSKNTVFLCTVPNKISFFLLIIALRTIPLFTSSFFLSKCVTRFSKAPFLPALGQDYTKTFTLFNTLFLSFCSKRRKHKLVVNHRTVRRY